LNGVISSSGNPAHSYVQLYRDGRVEAVIGGLLAHEHNGKLLISRIAYEKAIVDYLP
jgi:hypothetical protein